MNRILKVFVAVPALIGLTAGLAVHAQSNDQRLFLSFAEDATLVDQQWWEGRLELADSDSFDVWTLRGIVAFQPWEDIEVGGTVGFGSSDTSGGLPDGSGATDLDVWGKFHFGRADGSDSGFALGAKVTLPTGDDTSGLGFDAVSFSAFGSLRHALDNAVVAINAGVQVNDDGRIFGISLNGETAPFIGAAVIFPINDGFHVLAEAVARGERFDGLDSDARVLGGLQWAVGDRGIVRASVEIGLTDGAPDFGVSGGYAVNF